MPEYGDPVLLYSNNVIQHVTYMRDGADDVADWFEPYYFEHDDNCKVHSYSVDSWMPLPEPPKE